MKRPKIRSQVKTEYNDRVKPIQTNSEAYNCGNRNYTSCYNYLLSATDNDPAVHQLFDLLDSNVKYNSVKAGNVNIVDLIEDNDTMSFFCGGSECGNYYGVGSCNGTCCGFGGLGIGCNFKFKNRNERY